MKKLVASVLCLALIAAVAPFSLIALAQNTGEISGTAVVEGQPLPNVTVRLRNVDNGQLVGDSLTTNEKGEFRFSNLPAGNFVVETVAPNGTLLGTSQRIVLVAGAMVATGVAVSTGAAAAAAAGVGAGAAAGAAAAGGTFFATTAGIITVAAVGAGVAAAAVATTGDASPSQ
jgi:hypothetical protein